MKERPILFSAAEIRAILDGSKTQTRRIVKPQPYSTGDVDDGFGTSGPRLCVMHGELFAQGIERPGELWADQVLCPYGALGDRLWVKETHHMKTPRHDGDTGYVIFRADFPPEATPPRWRPSIFMPRWASRITLEIDAVRVERLNDISEADAKAEGVLPVSTQELQSDRSIKPLNIPARDIFRDLWGRINGPGSWALNPWVWIVEFKRVTA